VTDAVHIWVRQTAAWDDPAAYMARVPASLRPRVALWDETFTLPFHAFRHRIREIARQSLATVEGARVSAWDDIPEGALVLPVDDDDWFAPDVAHEIVGHVADHVAVTWPSVFAEVPLHLAHRVGKALRDALPGVPPKYVCTTNNYALVKRADHYTYARDHVRASRWYLSQPPGMTLHLDRRLSVMNRTLASMTSLSMGRGPLLGRYARYRHLYHGGRLDLPDWSQPYVAQMAELMADLRPR
jgi:hypothetical protein